MKKIKTSFLRFCYQIDRITRSEFASLSEKIIIILIVKQLLFEKIIIQIIHATACFTKRRTGITVARSFHKIKCCYLKNDKVYCTGIRVTSLRDVTRIPFLVRLVCARTECNCEYSTILDCK